MSGLERDTAEMTIRIERRIAALEEQVAVLERRVEHLATLHDLVAADVSWMEA